MSENIIKNYNNTGFDAIKIKVACTDYIVTTVKNNKINYTETRPAYLVEKVVFDSTTYNFHVFPESVEKCEKLANEFATLRTYLLQTLHNHFEENNHEISDCFYKNYHKDTIMESIKDKESNRLIGGPGSASRGKGAKEHRYIYKYIVIYYKDAYYSINFMRYTCKDNVVGCTMRAIQFHKDYGDINRGKDNKFEICYPSSDKDCTKDKNGLETTTRTIGRGKTLFTNVCCNPPVAYPNIKLLEKLTKNEKLNESEKEELGKQISDIVNCFIEFIIHNKAICDQKDNYKWTFKEKNI